jgi:hypothetical protein
MKRIGALLLLVGLLAGCSNFFEGGVIFGGPTVLVARENFSFTTETDQNNQTCPPSAQDPCGPFIRSYSKKSLASLTPVQVVKYRTVSANGQSKVVNLPAPIEVY